MKRLVCTCLCICLCAGLLAGCGTTLEADSSLIYVDKKGNVSFLDVQELDQDYYDGGELETFVNEEVDAYNEAHGKGAITVDNFSVEGQYAKAQMKYKTAEDFSEFHGMELYQGKVVASLAAGYVYDGDFVRVEDGNVVGTATKQEIYQEDDLKVVIVKANLDVKIEGEICYVSCQNVKLNGKDSVSIREGYSLNDESSDEGVLIQGNIVSEGTESVGDTEGTEALRDSGTEQVSATELPDEEETAQSGSVSFQSEVYTYIVYK